MASGPGHIELERALDSIRVGARHRADLGDLDQLSASIGRVGLLQPITISPDGILICGARRLAALKLLGVKTVNVWVRSGISDRLGLLLAEQDENTLHKPLTQIEQAGLYRELKALLAEDAARRQEATRFTTDPETAETAGTDGGATVTPPSGEAGKARVQAARMVTGRDSHTTLERVGELQRLAADETQPDAVRRRAAMELAGVEGGGSVTAAHQRTRAELALTGLDQAATDPDTPLDVREQAGVEAARLRARQEQDRPGELERLAAEALARVKATSTNQRRRLHAVPTVRAVMSVRAFVLTWGDLDLWWERADPTDIGPALTVAQWGQFERTVAGTLGFLEDARAARQHTQPHTA